MKRAHVSLVLMLGAVSASLSAFDFSRGQVASAAVDESRICPCPDPVDGDSARDNLSGREVAGFAFDETCPFESSWHENWANAGRPNANRPNVASGGPGEGEAHRYAVTTVANWTDVPEPIDADTASAVASHGDASWYELQTAECDTAPSCAELPANEPFADELAADEYFANQLIAEGPVVAATDPVVDESPAGELIADESLVDRYYASETLVEEPLVEEFVSLAQESLVEELTAYECLLKRYHALAPIEEESLAEEAIADESLVDRYYASESYVEESLVEESPVEELTAYECLLNRYYALASNQNEPPAEELVADESLVDRYYADNPFADCAALGRGDYDGWQFDGRDCGDGDRDIVDGNRDIVDCDTWADAGVLATYPIDTEVFATNSESVDSDSADSEPGNSESVTANVAFRAGVAPEAEIGTVSQSFPSCDYLSGCEDAAGVCDEDRYGYLQPWCEEDNAVDSQTDCYDGGCAGPMVEVPSYPVATAPHVESRHDGGRDESGRHEGWSAVCGVVTEPVPWMLPSSLASEAVESSDPPAGDVIGLADIAAAYDSEPAAEAAPEAKEAPVAEVDTVAVVDAPIVVTARSVIGLCLDPRHSTGNDVVRWLNRLNDGLGDEVLRRDIGKVTGETVASTPVAEGRIASDESSMSELAKEKIAAAGPSLELPEPWWATLGVATTNDLVAENAANTDPVDEDSHASDSLAVAEARNWAPPAEGWTCGEWPGCDAFCDESYDATWPTGPQHWTLQNDLAASVAATAPPAEATELDVVEDGVELVEDSVDLVEDSEFTGDAADLAAGEVAAVVASANSLAAAQTAQQIFNVAINIARDWSVLLDGRAAQGAAIPRVARREPVTRLETRLETPRVGRSTGQDDSGDSALSPIESEQIWCDAARWPYEDL